MFKKLAPSRSKTLPKLSQPVESTHPHPPPPTQATASGPIDRPRPSIAFNYPSPPPPPPRLPTNRPDPTALSPQPHLSRMRSHQHHHHHPSSRRPFVHHSKWRNGPRWLSVPRLVLLAFFAGVVSLYFVAFSTSSTNPSRGGGGAGMLAAVSGSGSGKDKDAGAVQSLEAEQDPPFHVVFSTSCSPFQDWQALLLFLTAEMVGQKVRACVGRGQGGWIWCGCECEESRLWSISQWIGD
jgi:hypothetical protein